MRHLRDVAMLLLYAACLLGMLVATGCMVEFVVAGVQALGR